ncbi:MAG: gas vesicle protein [Methanotrichaceae archaeon]
MEPKRNTNAGLVDLLDRVLDKGLVLNADMLISVAGIPLLGLNLKAALAGMDTMLKYGIWKDWDAAQRAWATEERRRLEIDKLPLQEGEDILLSTFGTHWYSNGIYQSWRPGHIYVTNRRILVYRRVPAEILFMAYYGDIEGFAMEKKANIAKKETDYLCIMLKSGSIAKLHPTDAYAVKDAVVDEMNRLGFSCRKMSASVMDENADKFLKKGERLVHCEKMWHLVETSTPGGISKVTWKAGGLYITSERVCWWHDFDERIAFELSLEDIVAVGIETRDLGGLASTRPAIIVSHRGGDACFSGDDDSMEKIVEVLGSKADEAEETETCPSCGAEAPEQVFLTKGCLACGWISPRIKRLVA